MISYVELVNWCQHRRFRADFGPGLRLIVGPNGAGKSNIIAGIVWLWTGKYLVDGKKEENICSLAPPGEHAYGRLGFQLPAGHVEVVRYLYPARKSTIAVNGVKIPDCEGDLRVTAKLAELTNVNPDMVPTHVISQQTDILGFLAEEPEERSRSFQKLFRTAQATICAKVIAEHTNALTIPDVGAELEAARAQFIEAENQVNAGQLRVAQTPDIANYAQVQQADSTVIEAMTRKQYAVQLFSQAAAADAHANREILTLQTSLATMQQNEATLARAVENGKAEVDAARAAILSFENYRRTREMKQQLERDRDAALAALQSLVAPVRQVVTKQVVPELVLPPPPVRPPLTLPTKPPYPEMPRLPEPPVLQLKVPMELTLDAYYEYSRGHRLRMERLIETFTSGAPECPTCGTVMSSLAGKVAEAQRDLPTAVDVMTKIDTYRAAAASHAAAVESARATWQAACNKIDYDYNYAVTTAHTKYDTDWQLVQSQHATTVARLRQEHEAALNRAASTYQQMVDAAEATYQSMLRTYESQRTTHQTTYDQAVRQLSTVTVVTPPAGDEAALQQTQASYEQVVTTLAQVREAINRDTTTIARWRAEIEGRTRSLQPFQTDYANPVTEADVQAAQQRIDQRSQQLAIRQNALSALASAEAVREERRTVCQRLEAAAVVAEKQRTWVRQAADAQELLKQAARLVATRNLALLEVQMNDLLQQCGADYRVHADETLSFTGRFFDGRVQRAARFSGGQKTLLVLLFKILVTSQFAAGAGTQLLDEPTAWLDKRRIAAFEPLLERVQQILDQRRMQMILVTHEEELAALSAGVVRVGS